MTDPFVWFQNNSGKPSDTSAFYVSLLGWKSSVDGPPGMTMFLGNQGPFAGVTADGGQYKGWVPYAEVENVEEATEVAAQLGGVVLQRKTRGPAGDFSIVRDPGGAAIALWQRAQSA